ncbi:hypothetical protein AB0K47_14510 [Streptomyces tirandamycinicus]|uniref:hypothetical protein n=1 Tax=Streptomyces TaxID=1883 RepID=UPI000379496E|nr:MULTISPECIES: hypothetical protein [Streptomyces]MCY0981646.1 hypothetical protein [Streptomyces tirandamycinicus]NNJ05165.1 hypothetical protein [Streptomyces sp. PKU-MA01144]
MAKNKNRERKARSDSPGERAAQEARTPEAQAESPIATGVSHKGRQKRFGHN